MTTSTATPPRKPKKIYQRVQLTCDPEKGRTRQDHKDECDINLIMAKFQKTGAQSHVANTQNNYGYASSITFTEAMQTVATGERMFAELPSSLRAKFRGDPAKFLAFVQDSDNIPEMHALGMLSPERSEQHLLAVAATEAASVASEPTSATVTNDNPISPTNPGT